MALYTDPKIAILNALSGANGITLDPSDYSYGTPEVLTPEEAVSVGGDANTKVLITANNVAAPYQGSQLVYYRRLDFADIAVMTDFVVRSEINTNAKDLVPAVNARFGMVLQSADIESRTPVDMGGYHEVEFKAMIDSLGWIGAATLTVRAGDLDLTEHLVNVELNGLNYPTPYLSRDFADYYSYWRDFSHGYETLNAIVETQALSDLEALRNVLEPATEDAWTAIGQSDYALYGSTLVYAGPATAELGYNPTYDYVVRITLSAVNSLAIAGDLILHFNGPADLSAV